LIIWSSSFVAIKIAYETYPPITLGATRFIAATLILGALTLLPKNRVRLEKKDILPVAVSGLMGITLYAVLQNIAMQWTSASSATLIIASYPIITLLLETLIYKTKLSAVKCHRHSDCYRRRCDSLLCKSGSKAAKRLRGIVC
jgi:drug/metabolite transporter (DMT)-like permease